MEGRCIADSFDRWASVEAQEARIVESVGKDHSKLRTVDSVRYFPDNTELVGTVHSTFDSANNLVARSCLTDRCRFEDCSSFQHSQTDLPTSSHKSDKAFVDRIPRFAFHFDR